MRVMRKVIRGLGMAVVAGLIWGAVQLPDSRLHMVFCQVGQGDSILLVKGSGQLLIDGGPGERVLACLGREVPFWDRQIELMVNTHGQRDHLQGLLAVADRYRVEKLVVGDKDGAEVKKLVDKVKQKGGEVVEVWEGDVIKAGEIEMVVLWPEEEEDKVLGASNINEQSVVLQGSFGEFDWLLTGDVGQAVEEQLKVTPVEVLKVAHHGSKFSTGEEFLARVRPQLGVIQVGKNSFGHPTKEVLRRLESQGVRVLRSDRQGTIEVVSDGYKWWLE